MSKGHIRNLCKPNCDNPFCTICQGGLAYCKICGLYEGGLTTECPGKPSQEFSDLIYEGVIDFENEKWHQGNGKMPCYTTTIKWDLLE